MPPPAGSGPAASLAGDTVHAEHPVAGPSAPRPVNPQLGPEPWFTYPTPTADDIEHELPPYFEEDNVAMGEVLDRLVMKGYGDLRSLIDHVKELNPRQKPKPIIEYAKTQRQGILKYLAVLRWKISVDVVSFQQNIPNGAPTSFPTPLSNSESNTTSPAALGYVGKGKGRAADELKPAMVRGKVTDAKRITQFMEHQNRQHEHAIGHVRYAAETVERLRERNPDLLTAIQLVTMGTYDRLPTSHTQPFLPRKPLTNALILSTLRQLNQYILYRLRCVDYLPPDMVVDRIANGRAYVSGGGLAGWKAELTMVASGEHDRRWWLTGVEWVWKEREKGVDDPGGDYGERGKHIFAGEERQQILDLANAEVLSPTPANAAPRQMAAATDEKAVKTDALQSDARINSPLIRIYNFLQHLSLNYQLEVCWAQAMQLSQARRQGQLLVEMNRDKRTLILKYWARARPAPQAAQVNIAVGKRIQPTSTLGATRPHIFGGMISISIEEISRRDPSFHLLDDLTSPGIETVERILDIGVNIRWEVGEAGVGGNLKSGVEMDSKVLHLNPSNLDLEEVLRVATQEHAVHLTRSITSPLIGSPRIALFPLNLPSLRLTDNPYTPMSLAVPLPARQRDSRLLISVSALTGQSVIAESRSSRDVGLGQTSESTDRTKMAVSAVNEHRSRLIDEVAKLISAIVIDGLETQARQLGWRPTRRLPLRSSELSKHGLHPSSTVFVPLPTSSMHYFVSRITTRGIAFELVRLARVPADNGIGSKLVVAEKSTVDVARLRQRRQERSGDALQGVKSTGGEHSMTSSFDIDDRDLMDLFIFANALVAQTIVEQQLKDRAIPYSLHYPPTEGSGAALSSSAVAGMVPTICVHARDLLKDGRAADVAMDKVYMQIKGWWKGGKCHVITIMRLRHQPSVSPTDASPSAGSAATSSAARAEGISFDQKSSVVKFEATDISRCVPAFLEQWERLSKVIVVAVAINRLNKSEEFRDLRMLSFDLRTATFAYAPGFHASITYTPSSDSYQASFFRSSAVVGTTPATPTPAQSGESNPHELIAPLLSHRLNDLVSKRRTKPGSTGVEFIGLLRNTLPLLIEIDSIRAASPTELPALVIRSIAHYRLVWDRHSARYAIDIQLVPGDRYLIADAASPAPFGFGEDSSCGPLTSIEHFDSAVDAGYEMLRSTKGRGRSPSASYAGGSWLGMKLDRGRSLVCPVGSVGEVVRCVVREVERGLGFEGGDER